MAITVPDNPKVYTTKYDNFRGVDMTNDPSNVWYRRSPDGKNMLPDMDGRPYKRTGWDVMISGANFKEGAQSLSLPTADRTHYFELGGYDYMAVFNSLGLFIITSEDNPNTPQSLISAGNPFYINGDVVTYHNRFIPLSNQSSFTTATSFDANRAFFFEGGGEAGFYIFCSYEVSTGSYKQTLVRMTVDSPYLKEVEPYVPSVLIMCDQYGTGEFYEPVNMLSEKRKICYANDEQGITKYYLPTGEQYLTVHKVETRQANGDWTTVPSSSYSVDSVNHAYIEFTSHPAHVIDGEDNLRVTYTPVGSAGTIAHRSASATGTLSITHYLTFRQRCVSPEDVDHNVETPVTTRTIDSRYNRPTTTFSVENIVQGTSTVDIATSSSWSTLDASNYTLSYTSYNNGVQITPTDAFYNSHSRSASMTRTTTEWSRGTGANGETRDYFYRTVYDSYTVTKSIRHNYTQFYASTGVLGSTPDREAFWGCTKSMIFGNGIINQVFLTATNAPNYSTRVWYSGATDPTYFADDNYIEVGASDKPIMGFLKIGQYLGIVKGGNSTNEAIYLAYPTSFEDMTTFAVKQSIGGIGAVTKGAFNILNTEPLFLSNEGVMGVDETESDDRKIRNRSVFVNKALCSEDRLSDAVSFVYNGMYWLAFPNGHCYVLDGAQKTSWANEKTNMQYEAYYLENVPAQCFAKYNGSLWFSDFKGNLCRFKTQKDEHPYRDDYYVGKAWLKSLATPEEEDGKYYYDVASLRDYYNSGEVECSVGDVIVEASESYENYYYYVIEEVLENNGTAVATRGCAINASWATIADDDGAVHYFKSLQKKGCLVSLLPDQKNASGVDVYLRKDENEPIHIGKTDEKGHWLPFEYYIKKKVKKYKRLQIICQNNELDESFGIDEIIKMYTIGNFSKNKR